MALKCASANDINYHVHALSATITAVETEDSWDKIASALTQLSKLSAGGASEYPDVFVGAIRPLGSPIASAMKSERTRLSGVAIDLVSEIASGLGKSFEPLLHAYFPVLLSLCARTNKVVLNRARSCILVIIESTQLPSILSYFMQSMKDKSASLRVVTVEGALACMNCFNPPDLEKDARAKELEAMVKLASKDPNADVRKLSKKLFEAYKLLLPHRVESFVAPLTPTIKKYLNVALTQKPVAAVPKPQKKPLAASTSAVETTSSSSLKSMQSQPLAKSTSAQFQITRAIPSREPSRPPKATNSNSISSRAMPPPATLPVRPALPSKSATASLSNLREAQGDTGAASRPPVRLARPDPKPTSSTSMPQRPPMRIPKPESVPTRDAVTFPTDSGSEDGVDNARSSPARQHGNIVRAVPGHTRTRSLFGKKPELPQLGKRPEPKPKVVPVAAKSSVMKTDKGTTSLASSTSSSKASSARTRPPPTGGFAATKSSAAKTVAAPVKKPATAPTASTKKKAAAATKREQKEKVASKPMWGHRAKLEPQQPEKKTVRSRPASRAESRPTSRIEARSISRLGTRPTSRVGSSRSISRVESRPVSSADRVETPASESGVHVNIKSDLEASSNTRGPTPFEEVLPQEDVEVVADDLQQDPETEEEEVDAETGDVAESMKMVAEEHAVEEDEAVEEPKRHDQTIQIAISQPTPQPATPTAAAERKAWEARQLEKTPITSLLASIEQGFLFTPSSPLSPPARYINRGMNDATNLLPLDYEDKQIDSDTKESRPFLFGSVGGESVASR